MRFNNFLNRLKAKRIYAIIIIIIMLIVFAVSYIFVNIFRVKKPEAVFSEFMTNLSAQDFGSASALVHPDTRVDFETKLTETIEKDSPEALILNKIFENTSYELVSQSSTAEDQALLRYSLDLPNIEAILTDIKDDMQADKIDTTDPELVRIGEDKVDMILYYAYDNFDEYKNQKQTADINVSFKKETAPIKDKWFIVSDQELIMKLSSNLEAVLNNLKSSL